MVEGPRIDVFVLGVLLLICNNRAHAQAVNDAAPPASVTVEASRDRAEVRRRVDAFVSGVAVQPWRESLARWNAPICLLVGGLNQEHDAFIFRRVLQVATEVGTPAVQAGKKCHPNFYVMLTSRPDEMLEVWRKRDPMLFNLQFAGKAKSAQTPPVRVWYNAAFAGSGGVPLTAEGLAGMGSGQSSTPINSRASASRLARTTVESLVSVVVLVDIGRVLKLSFGQLSDYIALLGLAEVHLDADTRGTGSILSVFNEPVELRPPGLSDWDRAYLKALYHSDQGNVMQLSTMKTLVLKDVAP